jgi:hypothetical protein
LLLHPNGIVFATDTPKIGSFESRHVLGRENQIIRGNEPVKPFWEVLLSVEERRRCPKGSSRGVINTGDPSICAAGFKIITRPFSSH